MLDSKYGKFLTIVLIVVIVAIVGLLSFLGYDFYRKYFIDDEAQKFTEEFQNEVKTGVIKDKQTSTDNTSTEDNTSLSDKITSTDDDKTSTGGDISTGKVVDTTKKRKTYKGFETLGTIDIPKTDVHYPILANVSKNSIEVAVAVQYGPGPNKVGNTIIVGHNYRNGQFFSNNKKLVVGDAVYITDLDGNKIKYIIYNKYETTPEDTDYMVRSTDGKREISLSTCTDDSKKRLILWAREEG